VLKWNQPAAAGFKHRQSSVEIRVESLAEIGKQGRLTFAAPIYQTTFDKTRLDGNHLVLWNGVVEAIVAH
jgi:hypothetical protein